MGIQPIRKQVAPEIPDKLYFRIGDVARLCEVPAYVLRFWETEFPQLKPNKGGTGQRLYRKRDVEMALRIKSLLYDQGYTIPGARGVFKTENKGREIAAAEPVLGAAGAEAVAAEPTAVATEAAVEPAVAPDPGMQFRRQAKLRALQSDLRALLTMLEQPTGAPVVAGNRLQAMRPRLVAEPRPTAPRPERLRLVLEATEPKDTTLRDSRNQGDLFSGE